MKANILLVDDEPGILRALQRLFRTEPYTIYTANSGAEGLEILAAQSIDLILSDMKMPRMDGAEFLTLAKQKYPDAIRLILTGYADMESTIKAINDGGVYGYLTKPWEAEQLKSLIRAALEQKLEQKKKSAAITSVLREHKSLKERVTQQSEKILMADRHARAMEDTIKKYGQEVSDVLLNLLDLKQNGQRLIGEKVERIIHQISDQLSLNEEEVSMLGVAGKLYAVGKIGLDEAILKKPILALTEDENRKYLEYPAMSACALMSHHGLQEISQLIMAHKSYLDRSGTTPESPSSEVSIYSRILTLAIDYIEYRVGLMTGKPLTHDETITLLQENAPRYDERIITAITTVTLEVSDVIPETDIQIPVMCLRRGMILNRDIYSHTGTLILRKDSVMTETTIAQLQRIQRNRQEPMIISVRFEIAEELSTAI